MPLATPELAPKQLPTRVLVYEPYGGAPCPVTPLLVAGGASVCYVCHAATLPELPSGVERVEHLPLPQPAGASGLLGRLAAASRRQKWDRRRREHLASIAGTYSPKVIVAVDVELGVGVALATGTGMPVVALAKGSDVLVVPHRKPALRRLVANNLKRCAGALVFGESHREAVLGLVDDQAYPTWSIPAHRDLTVFRQIPELRKQGEVPVVLCLRGTRAVYRPFEMIRAAAIAYRSVPLKLRFLSYPEDAEGCRKVALEAGLPIDALELVTTKVAHNQMPQEYAKATLVAQALLNESLGFTGVEAMACGRVVVQPDSAVAREVLNPEQWHLLSGPEPESIAARMVEVLTRPEERLRLETSNAAFAEAHYDSAVVVPAKGRELVEWLDRCRSLHKQERGA